MDVASSSKTINSSISEMSTKRMISMQRDLTAAVTNIQTAADARESKRRKELQEARKTRLELLENNVRSSQNKAEEIFAELSSTKEKVIPQELQEALNSQQNICTLVLEDKNKLINDLQKELKVSDDRFVKDLRRMAEELDLMKERMEDQIKTLTGAYREEMSGVERFCLQEIEVLVTKDKTEWEEHMQELWDQELERLEQRKEKVVEYEAKIHRLMLENMDKESIIKIEQDANFQALDIDNQKMKASTMIMNLQQIKQKNNVEVNNFNLSQMYERISSLQVEIKKLVTKFSNQAKYLRDTSHHLKKDYKRILEQHERVQKKIKHFAVADAGRFKEMWRMVEAEMALLVEKALATDSEICEKHLGLAWDRPVMPFRELSGPIRPEKQTNTDPHTQLSQTEQDLECSQGAKDMSDRASSEAESTVVDKEGSDAGLEEEMLARVSQLLCDATGLIQENILMLLTPLEEDVQTAMKLGSFLYALGLADEDFPKLAHFLLKYRQEQSEDVSGELSESSDQEEALIIHPNQVLTALKGFLQQHKGSRENSDQSQSSGLQTEPRDSSADRVYWESLSNIITEDKVRLWEAAEESLQQHLVVLTEISELDTEKESLEQENTELRLLLQQSLNS
ncbi:dynein regulatory complex protein 1 [Hippoglossus stenolepis]|uniref:dynein regulatory complex protein 1 n=1 Tax=Hippoglossus stenolepis TaxID=195615 RepID=UPI00159CAE31|nr:dynein regulatory complex protein 1 [Hippoglossus stenolepis]XP_047193927.1 dynein regulatory complex protein 1 [Hippoglossus stenolepis]